MKILNEEENRCRSLVIKHKDLIEKLSNVLLEKKTIEITDILNVLGERPFKTSESFSRYVEEKIKV